jgi:phosphotriesterase-related protein
MAPDPGVASAGAPAPGIVRTVLGDVTADALGPTLAHEHLMIDLCCYWQPGDDEELASQPVSFDNLARVRHSPWASRDNLLLDDLEVAIREVAAFKQAGGGAIIDVTCRGIGRDLQALRLIATRTGVHVVGATGYYIAASHPPGLAARSIEDVASELVGDITEGVGATGIRAGVIGEVGAGTYPMTSGERLVLVAAARAQRQTGAAIVAHPTPGSVESAFEIATVLGDAGARMDKVVISHLDERFRGDVQAFRRLAGTGCLFGFDTFGREMYFAARKRQHPSDADRITTILALADAGLADRIVVAQDICLKIELESLAGQGYARIMRETLPRLRHEGLDDALIHGLLVTTPARVFALDGPLAGSVAGPAATGAPQ